MYMCFSKTPALSPTGDARPFDAAGDGTILGEGLGIVVLKRLADAERDGDRIYAVIRGVGTSSDGKGNAVYAPSAAGQVEGAAARRTELAGVTPDTIELVEAHGTGTRVGDADRGGGADRGLPRRRGRRGPWCALGSVKSQIGHTKAAAGAAGLIKAALALHHKVLPPTIKVDAAARGARPGGSPFYVNTETRPWLPRAGHPRRAGVSAFGFGGSNFHCVLEEAEPAKPGDRLGRRRADRRLRGRLASSGLLRGARRLARRPRPGTRSGPRRPAPRTRSDADAAAPARCWSSSATATDLPRRCSSGARELLRRPTARRAWHARTAIYFGTGPAAGGLAILFPGQGSQYVGMLRDLACQFPAVHDALAEADAAPPTTAAGLSDRIYPHPAFTRRTTGRGTRTALRATEVAQPALGRGQPGACCGMLDALRRPARRGRRPQLRRADRPLRRRPDRRRVALRAGAAPRPADGRAAGGDRRGDARRAGAARPDRGGAARRAARPGHRQQERARAGGAVRPRRRDRAGGAARSNGGRSRPVRSPVAAAFHSPFVAAARGPFRAALATGRVPPARGPGLRQQHRRRVSRRPDSRPRPAGRPARPAGRVRRSRSRRCTGRASGPSSRSAPAPR